MKDYISAPPARLMIYFFQMLVALVALVSDYVIKTKQLLFAENVCSHKLISKKCMCYFLLLLSLSRFIKHRFTIMERKYSFQNYLSYKLIFKVCGADASHRLMQQQLFSIIKCALILNINLHQSVSSEDPVRLKRCNIKSNSNESYFKLNLWTSVVHPQRNSFQDFALMNI